MALNSANCHLLCGLWEQPTRADILWEDFVRLYVALGGEKVKSGSGSVRRFRLNGVRAAFHEPHPSGVMKKGAVDSARLFLANAGVSPTAAGCDCSRGRGRGGSR
ncbi:type II toxin-antitoxin system HicA family toxin [uncultured Enterovirga sp.]|uniref:type II toxin-antitoxin system HicA family toxin n=1 Tax=uncultured Enterovirga sp. TaxID=2026352 RepID=UPI0035C9CDBA